ncbi:MAG: hypothetical protein ACP5MD_17100, partial [Verrucomicrobiia bacterium]
WFVLGRFTSPVSFDHVTLRVTKLQPAGTAQYYWFAGVGVVPANWGPLDDKNLRFVDYTPITDRETSEISKGNFIPNSSFEFGLDACGWTSGRNGSAGNEIWLSNMTTNDAHSGQRAAILGDGMGMSMYAIYSPGIRLRGDRKERQYTLSFWHKRGGGTVSAATAEWGMVYEGASGFLTNTTQKAIFGLRDSWQRFSTSIWLKPLPNRFFAFKVSHVGTAPSTLLIDDVQFEEGPAATAYAPADPIECNMKLNRNGNLLNLGEPRTIILEFYNSTTVSTNVVFRYEAYDWMNRKLTGGSRVCAVPPGYSTQLLSLDTTNNGVTRMFGWIDSAPSFRSELVFSVVPLPSQPRLETNSLFGTHAAGNEQLVNS